MEDDTTPIEEDKKHDFDNQNNNAENIKSGSLNQHSIHLFNNDANPSGEPTSMDMHSPEGKPSRIQNSELLTIEKCMESSPNGKGERNLVVKKDSTFSL